MGKYMIVGDLAFWLLYIYEFSQLEIRAVDIMAFVDIYFVTCVCDMSSNILLKSSF